MKIELSRLRVALALTRAAAVHDFVELRTERGALVVRSFYTQQSSAAGGSQRVIDVQLVARVRSAHDALDFGPVDVEGSVLARALDERRFASLVSLDVEGDKLVVESVSTPQSRRKLQLCPTFSEPYLQPALADVRPVGYAIGDVVNGCADGLTLPTHALVALALVALQATALEVVSADEWRVARIEGHGLDVEIVEHDV